MDGTLLHLMASSLVVVLMCHGKQSRMCDYEGYKHLVPVCGEPLVQRTGRMLRELREQALIRVVAPDVEEWRAVTREMGADLVATPHPLFLAALPEVIPTGIKPDRFLILCGDVIFSPEILQRLVDAKAPVAFAGRFVPNIFTGRPAGELFGLSLEGKFLYPFVSGIKDMIGKLGTMRSQLEGVLDDRTAVEAVMEKNLRLWMLMHIWEDSGMGEVIECKWTDYIDDIDGPDDLERLPQIEEVIRRREIIDKVLEAYEE